MIKRKIIIRKVQMHHMHIFLEKINNGLYFTVNPQTVPRKIQHPYIVIRGELFK